MLPPSGALSRPAPLHVGVTSIEEVGLWSRPVPFRAKTNELDGTKVLEQRVWEAMQEATQLIFMIFTSILCF